MIIVFVCCFVASAWWCCSCGFALQTNKQKQGTDKSEKSFSEIVTSRRKGHNCKRDKSVENDTYDEPLLLHVNRHIYVWWSWVESEWEIERESHTRSQCVSVLRVAWLSIKSKIIIPISDCRIGFIFVSMSCNTFSRKNTIKNNMLMSRTKYTQTLRLPARSFIQCKQCHLDAQICLPLLFHSAAAAAAAVARWWCCFDVDFIAVTRFDIPSVVVIHQFAYAMMSMLFRWNYENWCWISPQEGKICFTNWIKRALSEYLLTQNNVNVIACGAT